MKMRKGSIACCESSSIDESTILTGLAVFTIIKQPREGG